MCLPFSIKWIYLIERRNFDQKYKFSNKNDMVSAWRNFKNIFSRPLFTIIFRPDMLKFRPYSILTGDTMVGFVIFCVLKAHLIRKQQKPETRRLLTVCFFHFPNLKLTGSPRWWLWLKSWIWHCSKPWIKLSSSFTIPNSESPLS